MKKRLLSGLIAILAIITLAGCTLDLRAQVPFESPHTYEQLRIDMIARVMPSVVAVKTETGHGTGIIFRSEEVQDGYIRYYIMTNYHVIEDGGEMKIHFGDVIEDIPVVDFAGNAQYDIAVVRIITKQVLRVHFVPSIENNTITEIVVGQDVYAIGTPQSISKFNAVSQGIVSLNYYKYNGVPGLVIMHDAELNPGNSGGPLFNLNGELIAINVAKVSAVATSDGSIPAEGLNYSLNINAIAPIVRGFTEADYQVVVRRPRLGITVQEVAIFLEENDASLLPENPVGIVIISFDLTRNAHENLEIYDLIIRMNGIDVASIADLASQLEDANFGDSHELTVLRNNEGIWEEVIVTIILS